MKDCGPWVTYAAAGTLRNRTAGKPEEAKNVREKGQEAKRGRRNQEEAKYLGETVVHMTLTSFAAYHLPAELEWI